MRSVLNKVITKGAAPCPLPSASPRSSMFNASLPSLKRLSPPPSPAPVVFRSHAAASGPVQAEARKAQWAGRPRSPQAWPVRVRHHISGRLRLSVPALYDDPHLARRLVGTLELDPAIESVRSGVSRGSIIIQYRPATLNEAALHRRVSDLLDELLSADAPTGPPRHRHPSTLRHPRHDESVRQLPARRGLTLTWPLADLSRQRTAASNPGRRHQDRVHPEVAPVESSCWLCDLNRYLTSRMIRFSLRCWWRECARQRAGLTRLLKALRPGDLWQRLRQPVRDIGVAG
ncbi:HMA2 domain-containing protein [Halochromatium glycolicum]|uniref:HMA2 domain-containing protein n=1 Tax=Halochromatium glycolicum TaxID=85075 RepID=UPI003B82D8ED